MSDQEDSFVKIIYVPELGCSIEFPVKMKIDERLLRKIQVAVQELIDVGMIAFPTLREEASEQRREAWEKQSFVRLLALEPRLELFAIIVRRSSLELGVQCYILIQERR